MMLAAKVEESGAESEPQQEPVLSKIDVTRDLAGAFSAPGNWRKKYKACLFNLEH